jgi:hypothetical protein
MEYMRSSYTDTPLSEFRVVDTYVCVHGGVESLEDDEDDEYVLEMRKKICRSERWVSLQGLTFDRIE